MASNVTRLAQETPRHLVRNVSRARRVSMSSSLRMIGTTEGRRNERPLERPSVLQKLGSELPIQKIKLGVQEGSPPALSSEEEVFKSQLSKIWDRMMTFPLTPKWKGIILSLPKNEWLSRITEHTPDDVKSMLVSRHPPTPAQVKSLPWSDTIDCGVFAWCTEKIGEQSSTEKTLYVYIGSASCCHGGLNTRSHYMLSEFPRGHDEKSKKKVKQLGLSQKGEFKRLFIVPFDNSFGDIMDVRALAILARMALMIWLGAVDREMQPKIQDLVPWGLENMKYVGLAGDNPLAVDCNNSNKGKKGEKEKGTE